MMRMRLGRVFALFLLFTFVFASFIPKSNIVSAQQTVYYVSKSGDDVNSGSQTSPFRHISKALEKAVPGDVINIMGGTYNEKLTFTKSGTQKEPITLQNYKDGNVLLSGTGVDGTAMMTLTNVNYINVKGFEIANNTAKSTDDCPVGILINGSSSNITVENCDIHDINTISNENGNSNPFLIIGNTAASVVKNITVKNNKIHDCNTGWSEGLTVDGNVDGWSLIGNSIYNISNIGMDVAGHWETGCEDPALNQARNGLIALNKVHDCGSPNAWAAGIYVDGAKNVVIERNTSYNCQYGFEIGCEQKTDTYDNNYGNPCTAENIMVRDNVAYNNLYCGLAVGGWNKNESGKVVNASILNNTLYRNDTANSGMGDLNIAWGDKLTIENNIVYGDDVECLVFRDPVNPVTNITMDYNLYYVNGKDAEFNFAWGNENDSKAVGGIENWRKISGLDAHSVIADPKFKDPASADFSLTSNSPAIDAGDPSFKSALNEKDFSGNERISNNIVDEGALEYMAALKVNETSQETAGNKTIENPKTGDNTQDIIFFGGSAIIAAIIVSCVSLRKKNKI